MRYVERILYIARVLRGKTPGSHRSGGSKITGRSKRIWISQVQAWQSAATTHLGSFRTFTAQRQCDAPGLSIIETFPNAMDKLVWTAWATDDVHKSGNR
jgi:hypothetical protein